MPIKLNSTGIAHARELVRSGKIDRSSSWSFSAEDSTALLGSDGNDWENYSRFFLGEDTSAAEKTKERFKYPYGKDGQAYRSGLIAVRQRAGQQNEQDIFDAAGEVLAVIDKNQAVGASALFAASVDMPAGADLPHRVRILPLGTWKGNINPQTGEKRTIDITPADVQNAIAYFHKMKSRTPERDLVVDNDHLTLKDQYAPAFGWIKDLVDAGSRGLEAVIDWTKLGAEALKDKLYRYISPVMLWNSIDPVTGEKIPFMIHSAALTNDPFFSQLVVAKKIIPLTLSEEVVMKTLIAKLIATFKLAQDATEEQIVAKFDEYQTAAGALVQMKNDLFAALGLKPEATIEEAKGLIVAAKSNTTSLQSLTQELATLKKSILEGKFEAVIAKAISLGRVTPAQKADAEWISTQRAWAERSFATFEDYFTAKAPQIVPLGEIKAAGVTATGAGLTDEDLKVAKALGVTKEQLEKHTKAA